MQYLLLISCHCGGLAAIKCRRFDTSVSGRFAKRCVMFSLACVASLCRAALVGLMFSQTVKTQAVTVNDSQVLVNFWHFHAFCRKMCSLAKCTGSRACCRVRLWWR